MTDIWVCANCRSVNNLRAKQCYQCRTPKDRAAVDPSEIDGTTTGQLREIELPEYQPSRLFAILAAVLIGAVAVVQAANSILSVDQVVETVDEFGFSVATIDTLSPLAIPTYVTAAAALVAFALWLSRAVASMPALGLGYPAATGTTAFLEVFIPGLNLMRIPAILRDVIRRLEPQEGRGDVLIYAAWIGLFGGILLPRVGLYLGLFDANTSDSGAATLVIVRLFSTLLVLGGAIFLVALIWWIEGRIAHRREQQLAGVPAPAPPVDVRPGTTAGLRDIPADAEISFRPTSPTEPAPAPGSPPVPTVPAGTLVPPTIVDPDAPLPGGVPEPKVAIDAVPPVLPRADKPPVGAPPVVGPPDVEPPVVEPPVAPATPVVEPPVAPVPPVAPTPAAPVPPPATARPVAPDPVLNRPITAAVGHAHLSDDAPLSAAATASAPPPAGPVTADIPGPGPTLRIEIGEDGSIRASIDGSEPEPATLDELREAAPALADAGGSVVVVRASDAAAGIDVATQVVTAFDAAGVPTTVEPAG